MSNYKDSDCINKKATRILFLEDLKSLNLKQIRYVGLPGQVFVIEKKICKLDREVHLFLAENDIEVYNKNIEDLPFEDRNVYYRFGNITSFKIPFEINAVWLDFFSYFNESLFNNLKVFLERNQFERRGLFAITISTRRENAKAQKFAKELVKIYLNEAYKDLSHFREKQLVKILAILLKNAIGDVKVKLSIENRYLGYGSTPMQYYAFTWNS